MAYRSFRSEECSARGVRIVTNILYRKTVVIRLSYNDVERVLAKNNWLVAAKRSQRRCFLILRCRLFLSLRCRSPKVSERELGLDRRETG